MPFTALQEFNFSFLVASLQLGNQKNLGELHFAEWMEWTRENKNGNVVTKVILLSRFRDWLCSNLVILCNAIYSLKQLFKYNHDFLFSFYFFLVCTKSIDGIFITRKMGATKSPNIEKSELFDGIACDCIRNETLAKSITVNRFEFDEYEIQSVARSRIKCGSEWKSCRA